MNGFRALLVDKASASNGRHWEQDRNFVIGLPKDHSNLVKFSERDACYDRFCQYLERLVNKAGAVIQSRSIPTDYSQRYDRSKLHFSHTISSRVKFTVNN